MKIKRIVLSLFIMLACLFSFNVKAYALDMKITDVNIAEKSSNVTSYGINYNDKNEINSDILLKEKDDYIVLDITIKNNDNLKYKIESIKDNLDNDYIEVTEEVNKKEIDKKSEFVLKVKIKYNKKLENKYEEEIKDLLVTIGLVREDGKREEMVIINPYTGDHLYRNILLLLVSLIGIFIAFKIKNSKKKFSLAIFVIIIGLIPFSILANQKYEVKILINTIKYIGEEETDKEAPKNMSLTSTNNLSETQTVTLKCDDEVGVDGYYFGLNKIDENTIYQKIEETKNMITANIISTDGKYYFACVDGNNNVSEVVEKDFYKTTLNMENGSLLNSRILTMEGNKFKLPEPTPYEKYEAIGKWYTNDSYEGTSYNYNDEYTPTSSSILYSKGELNVFTLTYDFKTNGGESADEEIAEYSKDEEVDLSLNAYSEGHEFLGWNTNKKAKLGLRSFVMPSQNTTLYAIFNRATFLDGASFNRKIKYMLGYEPHEYGDDYAFLIEDTQIVSIRQASSIDESLKTEEHIVSSKDSVIPIYAWIDGSTLYFYSEDSKPFLNEDSAVMFANFNKLESIATSRLDTSKVEIMSFMFSRCSSLQYIDLKSWNTSNVTYTYGMFSRCTRLVSLDLSTWDTSKVIQMSKMFSGCTSLTSLDISSFNTSKVRQMSEMFYNCNRLFNLDLSNFDTSNVETMKGMFGKCSLLKNLNISSFRTPKLQNMEGMFYGCSNFTELDLRNFDTRLVTSMSGAFKNCTRLKKLNLSSFDTQSLVYLGFQNHGYASSSYAMLDDTSDFQSEYMDGAFVNDLKLNTIYASDTFTINNLDKNYNKKIFYDNVSLIGGKGTRFLNSNNDYKFAKIDGGVKDPGYFSNLQNTKLENGRVVNNIFKSIATSLSSIRKIDYSNFLGDNAAIISTNDSYYKVYAWYDNETLYIYSDYNTLYLNEDSSYLFSGMDNLESVNLSRFNMSNVINMSHMFEGTCVNSIKLSNFFTEKVTDMSYMFNNFIINGVNKSLDLSTFNTNNVTHSSSMFSNSNIEKILVANSFNTSNITDSNNMFNNLVNIIGENGTSYDSSHIDKEYARIDTENNPGYFTSALSASLITGPEFNNIMKNAASSSLANITSIAYSDLDNEDSYVVSTTDSETPVHLWFDSGTIYIYSNGNKIYLNSNSRNMFSGLSNLESMDTSRFDTSKVTNMEAFFAASKITSSIDFTNFDMSKVSYMNSFFTNADIYRSNITDLDLSIRANLNNMFGNARIHNDFELNNLDLSNVVNVNYLFQRTIISGNLTITNILTSRTSLDYIFAGATVNNLVIDSMVSDDSSVSNMFINITADSITLKNSIFVDNTSLAYMFCNSKANNIIIDNVKANKVTDTKFMFVSATTTNISISNFETESLTDISNMFCNITGNNLVLDLRGLDTKNVTTAPYLFANSSGLKTIYVDDLFVTDNMVNTDGMFSGNVNLVGGSGTRLNTSYIDKTYAKVDSGEEDPGYFTYKERNASASISSLINKITSNSASLYVLIIIMIVLLILLIIYKIKIKERK